MNTSPLRTATERLQFCDTYFKSVGAECIRSTDMYREFRLPLDVDKELTDRPFFWLWAEKTNQKVEPTTLRLAFSEEAKSREDKRLTEEHQKQLEEIKTSNPYERMFLRAPQAELLDLGSFRLNKIVDSATQRGKFASVRAISTNGLTKMVPWFMFNGCVQRLSDSVQEEWFSIGVCLVNRQPLDNFYEHIAHVEMEPCSKLDLLKVSVIQPQEALQIAVRHLENKIHESPMDWAHEAHERLQDDLSQLDTYYRSILRDQDEETAAKTVTEHERKKQELTQKSRPRIQMNWTQMALVGLGLR